MKKTQTKGRNLYYTLAIIGLVLGTGATGALAVGLLPTLDQDISGSLVALVETKAPMLVLSDPSTGRTFNSSGNKVKFSADLGTIIAPDTETFSINVTVNEVPEDVDGLVIKVTGIDDPVRATLSVDGGTVYRIGGDEWYIEGPEAEDSYEVTFTLYADRDPMLTGTAIPMVFDIEMGLVQE